VGTGEALARITLREKRAQPGVSREPECGEQGPRFAAEFAGPRESPEEMQLWRGGESGRGQRTSRLRLGTRRNDEGAPADGTGEGIAGRAGVRCRR